MIDFSARQRMHALFWLSLFHLLVITSSNYLVQLPVSIFGFHTTWGAFSFPFIFLATDLAISPPHYSGGDDPGTVYLLRGVLRVLPG